MRTAKEAGSSRSCTAKDRSTLWIIPRVAVLTGVDAPTAPPPARGGGMKKYILLLAVDTGRWRSDLILVLVYLVHRQSSLNCWQL